MKRLLILIAFTTLFTVTTFADDLARLEGKWSVKKSGADGQNYTQVIEVNQDGFKFKLIRSNEDVAIYAEGHLKLEKSGPLNVVKFTDIKAGASESELQEINDDRVSIYVLGEDTWTIAANFDKERDNQKPSLDLYSKTAK